MKECLVIKRMDGIPEEVTTFITELFELIEIRGRIAEEKGIKFIVHTNEKNHSKPHVHAEYGEYSISIAIEDGEILKGNLPKRKQTFAVDWVLNHMVQLENEWNSIAISAVSSATRSLLD